MWLVEELDGGIVAASPRFSVSSGKTSHTAPLMFNVDDAFL